MKTYQKMKNSGIEWIGDIPEHWETRPLFVACKENQRTNHDHSISNVLSLSYGKIIPRDVQNNFGLLPESFDSYQIVIPGHIILRLTDLQNDHRSLRVGLVKELGIITSAYVGLEPNSKIISEYLYYLLHTYDLQKIFYGMGGGVRQSMKFSDLKRLLLIIPSTKEQKQIADFLESTTKGIDENISKSQKLVELLKEERQSIINQAVTKGLDPIVPMKDSGIEWIIDMPENWGISKIKYSSYVKGRVGWQGLRSEEFIDDGPYLITGTDFEDGKVNWKKCYHVKQWRYEQDPYIQVKEKDLLITKDGTIGKLAYVDTLPGKATLNSHLLVIRPLNNEFTTRFLYWVFHSDYFIRYVNLIQTGTTFYGISQESVENFAFILPEINEQNRITDFLDKKISKINSLISKTEIQIEKLEEYARSLISQTVTGKIDVRAASLIIQ